jgi:hypothetical protein
MTGSDKSGTDYVSSRDGYGSPMNDVHDAWEAVHAADRPAGTWDAQAAPRRHVGHLRL